MERPASRSSMLPVPSTTMKQQNSRLSTLRQSMGAARPPMIPPPSSQPKNQQYRINPQFSRNNNQLLASSSRPGLDFGRTPSGAASLRRTSHFPGRPISSLISGTGHQNKEPRQIRSKQFQRKMQDDILQFLSEHHCPLTNISLKTLQSPTTKDFQLLFKYLFNQIFAPEFAFGTGKESFEEELIGLMKLVRYPFADSISKNALAAVGGMTVWPSMLAMLHWMVEAYNVEQRWLQSDDIFVLPDDKLPPVWPEALNNRICMDYVAQTYSLFLNGEDEFPEADQALEDRFQRRDEAIFSEMKSLEAEIKELSDDIAKLSAPSPLEVAQEKLRSLSSELEKVEDSIQKQQIKREKAESDNITFGEAIAEFETKLKETRVQNDELSEAIKRQNLTPEEITRMTTDRDTLQRTLEDIRQRQIEINDIIGEREVAVTNRADVVETIVHDYTTLLYALNLHPHPPLIPHHPPFEDGFFFVEFNPATTNPLDMLQSGGVGSGRDLKKTIRPALIAIAEAKKKERQAVDAEMVKVDDQLDKLGDLCDRLREEIDNKDRRMRLVLEEADDIRLVVLAETQKTNAEAIKWEKELGSMRTASQQSGLDIKSRLESLRIEHTELVDKLHKFRETTVNKIIQHSEYICEFKRVTAAKLEELAEFAKEP